MPDRLAQGHFLHLAHGLTTVHHRARTRGLGVFLLPHACEGGLMLVLGLLCGTGTKNLLLGEHHRTTLGRSEFAHACTA